MEEKAAKYASVHVSRGMASWLSLPQVFIYTYGCFSNMSRAVP